MSVLAMPEPTHKSPEERSLWLLKTHPEILDHAAENFFAHEHTGSYITGHAAWSKLPEAERQVWRDRVIAEQEKMIAESPAKRELRRRTERKEMLDKNDAVA